MEQKPQRCYFAGKSPRQLVHALREVREGHVKVMTGYLCPKCGVVMWWPICNYGN